MKRIQIWTAVAAITAVLVALGWKQGVQVQKWEYAWLHVKMKSPTSDPASGAAAFASFVTPSQAYGIDYSSIILQLVGKGNELWVARGAKPGPEGAILYDVWNAIGDGGWELLYSEHNSSDGFDFYFKRPK